MNQSRPRVGITGSTGVTGRTLMAYWQNVDFIPFKGDIRKASEVRSWYESSQPLDGVVHLAALVPVHLVEADPLKAFEINVLGTMNLLEEVRRLASTVKPWFFYSSTSHVYATSLKSISENTTINPINMYGETKAQGDKWCDIYRQRFELPICVARIFSCSGPEQQKSYFVPAMIEKIRNLPQGATLEARGLNGTRDFLTTKQICEAIEFLFTKKITGVFNLGSGTPTRLLDMVEALKSRLGRDDISVKAIGSETHHLVANVEKLAQAGLQLEFNMDEFLNYIFSK